MTHFRILPLLLIGLIAVLASEQAEREATAKECAIQLAHATVGGDYATVVEFTYKGIIRRLGGKQNAIDAARSVADGLKDQGCAITAFEVCEPGEILTEGPNSFVLIPTKIEISGPRGIAILESHLLGISEDGRRTWKFADVDNPSLTTKAIPKLPPSFEWPKNKPPKIVHLEDQ